MPGARRAQSKRIGSDFVANATRALFAALDIEAMRSRPYEPTEKAHVERAIGIFQHQLTPLLPGFTGHNVADRKKIEERRSFAARLGTSDEEAFCVQLTTTSLQKHRDAWAEDIYQHHAHEGLGGASPFQVAAQSPDAIRTVEVRALDMLVAPLVGRDGYRTVTKSGIRVDGAHYLIGHVLPETRVFCRQDPADLGRLLVFDAAAQTYLGEAVCPALAGLDPVETVKIAKAEQKRVIDEGTAAIRREVKRIATGPALANLIRRVAARDATNVLEFPKTEVPHETPQIAAALDAVTPRAPAALSPEQAAAHEKLKAEFETASQPPAQVIERFPDQPKKCASGARKSCGA